MSKLIRTRAEKAGLPPGTLVHIGEKKTDKVKVTLIDYDADNLKEMEIENIELAFPFKDEPTVSWINIEGIHQTEIIEKLGAHFDIHPLILEDIVNTTQRPKLEDYGGYYFIILKMLSYNKPLKQIETEQVSLILGTNFVISVQEGKEGDPFDPIRDRIRNAKGRIRKEGADYLAYSLMDAIVDSYFSILEEIGEEIEDLEDELVTEPTRETLRVIHHFKREMILLRRSIWPLREVVSVLSREDTPLILQSTIFYFRDVYDHTIQVIDTIETFRDMISGLLDIYLSSISNKLNQVMKVLTIIATIFMPLTFLAGVYGMNFKYMPELSWQWGYPMVASVMLIVGIGMLIYFKRKKWI